MRAFRHVGICVHDLDKTLNFYKDVLGLKIVREMDESGVYIDNLSKLNGVKVKTIKMVADDGNLIELLCYRSHSEKPAKRKICNIGYSHIAFTVDDLEREYDKLKKQGINFNCPPQFSPDGKAKVVFCCDPEGNLIELVEELTRREGNE